MRINDLTSDWRFSKAALARLHSAAGRAFPREVCGALLGCAATSIVRRALRLPNRSADAGTGYLIPAAAVQRVDAAARRAGLEVVGFFHSHPDGSAAPSRRDLRDAWPGYLYVIVPILPAAPLQRDCPAPLPTAWRLADDRAAFHPVAVRIEGVPA